MKNVIQSRWVVNSPSSDRVVYEAAVLRARGEPAYVVLVPCGTGYRARVMRKRPPLRKREGS